jgi:hypothetical protein
MRLASSTVPMFILLLAALAGCSDEDPADDGAGASSSQSASSTTGSGGSSSGGSGGSGGSGSASGGSGGGGGGGGATPSIDCSGEAILHYEFHNQIVGSQLDITTAGVLTHVEHDCCPPADHPIDEEPLPAEALADLLDRIEAASHGALHVEEGTPTAEGSLSGTLQVCTAAGAGVILRDVARNDTAGGLDVVTVNEAAPALEIRQFVEAIVTQDMY